MPLQQRVIEPVNVSRSTLPLPPGDVKPLIKSSAAATGQGSAASAAAAANINIVNELECVTNGTLANLIRQLSSLSRQAEELLTGVFDDASKLLTRTIGLQQRMDALAATVNTLDQTSDAPVTIRDPTNQRETFSSDMTCDQQVLSKQKMPSSIAELYQMCDKPPPLNNLDPYRDDGKDGLKFYTDPTYFFNLWKKEMMKETAKTQSNANLEKKAAMLPKYMQQTTLNDDHHQHYQPQSMVPIQQTTINQAHQLQQQHHQQQLQQQQQQYEAMHKQQQQIQRASQNIQQYQQAAYGSTMQPSGQQQMLVSPPKPPQQQQFEVLPKQQAQASNQQHHQSQIQVQRTSQTVPQQYPVYSPAMNQQPMLATPPPPPALSPLPPPTSPPPPPPPPAPPAPPAPPSQTAAPAPTIIQPPTAAELQQKQKQLKKTVPVQRDPRSDLLAAIKQGITLRRVEDSKRRVEAEKQQSMGNDVASILARRVAMQVSDSDDNGDDDEEENDWDDSSNR